MSFGLHSESREIETIYRNDGARTYVPFEYRITYSEHFTICEDGRKKFEPREEDDDEDE